MGSLKALATQKTGKFEERAKLEKYRGFSGAGNGCSSLMKANVKLCILEIMLILHTVII